MFIWDSDKLISGVHTLLSGHQNSVLQVKVLKGQTPENRDGITLQIFEYRASGMQLLYKKYKVVDNIENGEHFACRDLIDDLRAEMGKCFIHQIKESKKVIDKIQLAENLEIYNLDVPGKD